VFNYLNKSERLSEKMIDIIEDRLDRTITVAIDAGPCGSWEVAQKLHKEGHKFVISCATNRPSWLWSWMKSKIQKFGDYCYSTSGNGITAIAWICNSSNKAFFVLTNIEGLRISLIFIDHLKIQKTVDIFISRCN
jgi:hypothetical protein